MDFKDKGIIALKINSKNKQGIKEINNAVQIACKEKIERDKKRGIINRPVRAMVVGIPNVGKSTFINAYAGRAATKTGNKPGVTKGKQWIKLNKNLELLDTPGILWPKFEDPTVGFHLALTGAIRDEILPKEEVVVYALKWLSANEPQRLKERYALENLAADPYALLTQIAVARKHLNKQGEADLTRTIDMVINEIRNDKLGPISWERPA